MLTYIAYMDPMGTRITGRWGRSENRSPMESFKCISHVGKVKTGRTNKKTESPKQKKTPEDLWSLLVPPVSSCRGQSWILQNTWSSVWYHISCMCGRNQKGSQLWPSSSLCIAAVQPQRRLTASLHAKLSEANGTLEQGRVTGVMI